LDNKESRYDKNEETQEKVGESAERAREEKEAFEYDPENQKMLALVESIKDIDPKLYERLTTEGMKSEEEIFQERNGG